MMALYRRGLLTPAREPLTLLTHYARFSQQRVLEDGRLAHTMPFCNYDEQGNRLPPHR